MNTRDDRPVFHTRLVFHSSALRQAKLDHLANASDELALPYYWAGMVLVGDVAPMELGSARSRWPWIAGTLVITLALFIWLRRRRAKV